MEYLHGLSPFGDRKSSSGLQFEEFVPPSAWTEDQTCHYLLVDLPGTTNSSSYSYLRYQTHIVVSGERQVMENKYKRFEQRFELPNSADVEKITGKLDGEILYVSVPKTIEQKHQEIKHGSTHGGKTDMLDPTPTSTSTSTPTPTPTPAQLSDVDENGDDDDEEDDDDDDKKSDQNEDERDNRSGKKDIERKKLRRGSDEDWGQEADLFLRLAIEKLRKNKGIVMTAIFAFSLGVLVSQKFQSNGQ